MKYLLSLLLFLSWTIFYSQNQIDLQGEIEELTMGLQNPINPPLIVNPGKFVYFDL